MPKVTVCISYYSKFVILLKLQSPSPAKKVNNLDQGWTNAWRQTVATNFCTGEGLIIFLDSQYYGTSFMSPFWRIEFFLGGSCIFFENLLILV